MSADEFFYGAVSDDKVERDVPGTSLEAAHLLASVRDTDYQRSAPALGQRPVSQGSIVVAAAHAETLARLVKCHEWREHHIERTCWQTRSRRWLVDAEAVGHESLVRVVGAEAQRVADEDRQVDRATAAPGLPHEWLAAELAADRRIDGDPAGARQLRESPEITVHASRSRAGRSRGYGGAPLPLLAPEQCPVRGFAVLSQVGSVLGSG